MAVCDIMIITKELHVHLLESNNFIRVNKLIPSIQHLAQYNNAFIITRCDDVIVICAPRMEQCANTVGRRDKEQIWRIPRGYRIKGTNNEAKSNTEHQ